MVVKQQSIICNIISERLLVNLLNAFVLNLVKFKNYNAKIKGFIKEYIKKKEKA